ncbi:MAG: O-antigen ligase family protein, partial [Lentisphaeria bacterium]|nr:O-antigen ligase family protein [Lentisphaeria bacterium]
NCSRWELLQFWECLWWVSIPLLAFLQYRVFRQLLPVYVLAIGGYGFLYSAVGDLRGIWNAGITGNVNWTAALFVMTMIFLGWFTLDRRDRCKQDGQRKMILGAGIAGELLLFWQVWRIGSKGAFLAAGLTALLFLFLRGTAMIRKILIALALLGLFAGSFWAVKHTDAIGKFINEDGRIILWENAVSLIADHPVFGVGQGAYENEYMRYRKADYFFILNPAARSNHPHNHQLYMAGSWGLAGLILWGILLFAPLAVMIRKYYRHETVDPLETACFLTLCYAVLHGSLDIIMESMPTGLIALLCLGILARHLADPEKPAMPVQFRKIMLIPALLLCVMAGLMVWLSCYPALQVRRAYRNELSAEEIVRTARSCPGEYQANFALLNYLFKRGETEAALAVTDVMLSSHTPNYPGVHMGRGNALMRLGRFGAALENYRVEAELFPLTLRPVYNMIAAARAMKDAALAAKLESELRERMRIRGNDERDLKIIITGKNGAHYDLRVREKPEE